MEVRRATLADVPAIRDIYNDAVLTTTATYDYEPRTLEVQTAWFEDHDRAGMPVFVAEDGGRVVGWSSLSHFHHRPGYRYTLEDSIYVAPDARGQGVGTRLIPPLIEAAPALGAHAIIAVIDGDSAISLHLHERFGFRPAGRLEQIGFKFDRWLDVIYMELLLP
jgi:phosphinothricin acetyltransferase